RAIGYVDSTGATAFSKSCKAARDLPARFEGKTHKTISAAMLVTCTLPAAAEFKGSKAGGGGQVTVTAGHTSKLVVSATMRTTGSTAGSTLSYDTRYCKTSPAPQPPKPSMYSFSGLTVSFDAQFASGAPATH